MEPNTRETGSATSITVKVFCNCLMEPSIQVSLRMEINMGKVNKLGLMAVFMKVSMSKIKRRVKASLFGQMVTCTMASGKMTNKMEKVQYELHPEKFLKATFRIIRKQF